MRMSMVMVVIATKKPGASYVDKQPKKSDRDCLPEIDRNGI
jgi:hypothetical protein